jgi:hypothetical protein
MKRRTARKSARGEFRGFLTDTKKPPVRRLAAERKVRKIAQNLKTAMASTRSISPSLLLPPVRACDVTRWM